MSLDFAAQIIDWQRQHGRNDLPWQNTCDPYAIWVSEIMLQQTQVSTVIPYYRRFMARFPDIATLAHADEDAALQHWSGLGYYSRARNLHAAAQRVVENYGGRFPQKLDEIQALPGIGRSTAAAISVFAFGQCCAILDGNVKRVLTRFFGIEGWPGQPSVEKQLWGLAENLLPKEGIEAYTQGLMDLGASLCSRSKPACGHCPLQGACVAHRGHCTAIVPTPKPRKALPERETTMLLLFDGNEVLLEKRPPTGIWGGLWSLPEAAAHADVPRLIRERYGLETELLSPLPRFTHSFTHFRLHITPQPLRITGRLTEIRQAGVVWLDREDALGAALPNPVRKLLARLK